MKTWNFIIFFSIVLVVYTLINFYIFSRAMHAFPFAPRYKMLFGISFWLIVYSYVMGRFLERILPSIVNEIFIWIGSFWMAAMLYLFLILLLTDLFRFINFLFPFFSSIKVDFFKINGFYASVTITFFLLIIGFFNALFPRTKILDVEIHKRSKFNSLNIAVVSDIHLGTIVGKRRFSRIINKIHATHPDIILLAGDVLDEDLAPVIRQNLGKDLKKLKARFGVFAIPGNHEYIGGINKAVKYLQEHGINVLRDEAILIDDDFYLIGRDDRSSYQFSGRRRKSLHQLMNDIDLNKPIILMDHQPFKLNEAVENGVDLQISGHTHHGQLFPLNFITNKVYEISWGYLKKENTHFYVSSGAGVWGPPIRLGNRPEIVLIRVRFKQ